MSTMSSCEAKKHEDHIADLRETFANFRKHGLKINPEKCVFGVRRGKLLGCMITERGIEANPVKIDQEGGVEVDRPPSFAEQIHFAICREITSFLQGVEGHIKFSLGF